MLTRRFVYLPVLAAAALLSNAAAANEACLVVGVTDGDTLKLRCGAPGSYQQITVRLAEVDAPEKGQPFGRRSRQSLSDLCLRTQALLLPQAVDRYGRAVGRVTCRGRDASEHQVERGMAWSYTRYLTDPQIPRLEATARASRSGLWADTDATAPWEWRADSQRR